MSSGPIVQIGGLAARWLSQIGALARFGFGGARAVALLPRAGRAVVFRVTLNQIRFTAVHAIGHLDVVLAPTRTAYRGGHRQARQIEQMRALAGGVGRPRHGAGHGVEAAEDRYAGHLPRAGTSEAHG